MFISSFYLYYRVKTTKIVVFSITPGIGALTLIIIYIGFLTTEETHENVYRTWKNVCLRYISSRTVSILMYSKIIILLDFG